MRLFAGTYTTLGGEGILSCGVDPETGALTRSDVSEAIINPSYLAFSPDKRMLYAVGENEACAVVASFRVTRDGKLSLLNKADYPGWGACHLSISPDGRFAVAACYGSGDVLSVAINKDGTVGGLVSQVTYTGHGVNSARTFGVSFGVQASPHAHCAVFTPCGRFVMTADLGTDSIYRHSFDKDTGLLGVPVRVLCLTDGGGPRHIAFDTMRKRMIINTEMGNELIICDADSDNGGVSVSKMLPLLESDMHGCASAAIKLSPDGRYVLVSNRAGANAADERANSISCFDLSEGADLRRILSPTGGKNPRDFAFSPDGRHIAIAHQDSGTITVHHFNKGALDGIVSATDAAGAACVVFG